MVFLIAWLGWSLDNTDFNLFALVLRPALTELLGGNPSIAEIGRVGGVLSMVGLLGWALGGFCFGVVGDYIGRIRTLALSVVMVAIFTALQGFSPGAGDVRHLPLLHRRRHRRGIGGGHPAGRRGLRRGAARQGAGHHDDGRRVRQPDRRARFSPWSGRMAGATCCSPACCRH